jgi:nucleoid-associated protein YgaU
MEKLINKRSNTFDYNSRYTGIAYYYDTIKQRDIYGIGKQIDFDTAYIVHRVTTGDTLDKLALVYYNNPTYWWAIAYFNKINDPFIVVEDTYKTLKIPTLSSVVFKD